MGLSLCRDKVKVCPAGGTKSPGGLLDWGLGTNGGPEEAGRRHSCQHRPGRAGALCPPHARVHGGGGQQQQFRCRSARSDPSPSCPPTSCPSPSRRGGSSTAVPCRPDRPRTPLKRRRTCGAPAPSFTYVNLIPYNPTSAGDRFDYKTPSDERIGAFASQLRDVYGVRTLVR